MFISTENHAEFEFWSDSIELYGQNDDYIDFPKNQKNRFFKKSQKSIFGGPPKSPEWIPPLPPILYTILCSFVFIDFYMIL